MYLRRSPKVVIRLEQNRTIETRDLSLLLSSRGVAIYDCKLKMHGMGCILLDHPKTSVSQNADNMKRFRRPITT